MPEPEHPDLPTLAFIIYSGGMDSFTLLHSVLAQNREMKAKLDVRALSFDYGQRHAKELDYAVAETGRLGVPHRVIPLPQFAHLLRGSALTQLSIPVPHGHYEAESMKKTVVPGRNAIMLSIAAGVAEASLEQGQRAKLFYGAHAGDHAVYPDCRPAFVFAMESAISFSTEGRVRLRAPFLYLLKGAILTEGKRVGLRAEDYARAWTCYEGAAQACGKCGACQERAEAFQQVGWRDPMADHLI